MQANKQAIAAVGQSFLNLRQKADEFFAKIQPLQGQIPSLTFQAPGDGKIEFSYVGHEYFIRHVMVIAANGKDSHGLTSYSKDPFDDKKIKRMHTITLDNLGNLSTPGHPPAFGCTAIADDCELGFYYLLVGYPPGAPTVHFLPSDL